MSTVGVGAYSQEMSVCYLWEASWLVEVEQSDLVLDEWRCAHSPITDTLLVIEEVATICASLRANPGDTSRLSRTSCTTNAGDSVLLREISACYLTP